MSALLFTSVQSPLEAAIRFVPDAVESLAPPTLTLAHLRRLKHYYRSAGWPVRDSLELDLLADGSIELRCAPSGHESVYVTPRGLAALSDQLKRNRRKLDAHQTLVERVAERMRLDGRMSFTRTSFRVKPGEQWKVVMPDVFSIRRSIDERYVHPVVHEIKVSRADLKGDLRNAGKRAGYLAVCSQLYYVFPARVGSADDVPDSCGVIVVDDEGQWIGHRVAPRQPNPLRPMHWLQLVASVSGHTLGDRPQLEL